MLSKLKTSTAILPEVSAAPAPTGAGMVAVAPDTTPAAAAAPPARSKNRPRKPRKKKQRKRFTKPATSNALAHSVAEFIERARLSRPTIYRMIAAGELRSVLVHGRRLIPVTEYARLGIA